MLEWVLFTWSVISCSWLYLSGRSILLSGATISKICFFNILGTQWFHGICKFCSVLITHSHGSMASLNAWVQSSILLSFWCPMLENSLLPASDFILSILCPFLGLVVQDMEICHSFRSLKIPRCPNFLCMPFSCADYSVSQWVTSIWIHGIFKSPKFFHLAFLSILGKI